MPDGHRSMALDAADHRFAVLQRRFHAPRLCACQSTAPAIYAASGDVGSGFANHLCDGGDGIDDQRAYDDGLPHPSPHAYVSVRDPRKRVVIALWKQYPQLDRNQKRTCLRRVL